VNAGRLSRLLLLSPIDASLTFTRDWIARFVSVQGVDRSVAIGAQAYTALIPLLIVTSSVLPRTKNSSFAEVLVDRLELSGSSADTLRLAFAPSNTVESSVTGIGVLLLIVSALSFSRALQRLYERVFGLPTRGMRNTKWGIVWLLALTAGLILRPIVLGGLPGAVEVAGSLAFSTALWLVTPYLLLGRRLHWRRLLPLAVLSAVGMAGVGIWTVVWLPHTITSSAQQFGMIGIGFAMLAWLVAAAGVLVVAASGGAVISDRLAVHSARVIRDHPGAAEDALSDPAR
jgi:membrane protein